MSGEASNADRAERLYILYGSESGNAESIAKRLHHDAATTQGFTDAECMTLNRAVASRLFDAQLEEEGTKSICVVIVCSTMGEGEPPQNAARFRRWLRNTSGTLHRTQYCVLALGDTNYNSFCAPGIFFDNKLAELGAVRCCPRGEADDGRGLHLVVEPWVDGVWAAIKKRASSSVAATGNTEEVRQATADISAVQGTDILYSSVSPLCGSAAFFVLERIIEMGGNANLCPIQFFCPSTCPPRQSKNLLFILSPEGIVDLPGEGGFPSPSQRPPWGPFTSWWSSTSDSAIPADAIDLQAWMIATSISFVSTLIIAPQRESATQAATLDSRVKSMVDAVRVNPLYKGQHTDEMPRIASSAADVYRWVAGVLGSLPGAVMNAEYMSRRVKQLFAERVGSAFPQIEMHSWESGATRAADDVESRGTGQSLSVTHHLSNRRSGADTRRMATKGADELNTDESLLSDKTGEGEGTGPTHRILHGLLTPVVFMFSEESSFVKRCAMEVSNAACQRHLRSSICEIRSFRQTGFPRRGTFVFIVSGVLTKSMQRLLRAVQSLKENGTKLLGVKFAILGINSSSQRANFNAPALELETLLLEAKATKVHCTGLTDVDCISLASIVQCWESNLWGAIVHPTTSAAYLDMASPSIQAQRKLALEVTGVTGTPIPLAVPGTPAAVTSDDGSNGFDMENATLGPTLDSAAAEDVASVALHYVRTARGSSFITPFPRFSGSTRGSVTLASSLAQGEAPFTAQALSSCADPPTNSSALLQSGESNSSYSVATAAEMAHALFPWDVVPLRREQACRTPVAILYSSAGMPKTVAVEVMRNAVEKGFPTVLYSFADFPCARFQEYPNLILFCEGGPDGQSYGGRRLKKFLTHSSHRPDLLSSVRFAALGLGPMPRRVTHPAFRWAKLLSRLHASRVFPVLTMSSMSQLHSLGMPWAECVLSSMALLPSIALPIVPSPPRHMSEQHDPLATATQMRRQGGPSTLPRAVSGFQKQPAQLMSGSARSVLFLFGSSTGITESIARDFHRDALERRFVSRVAALACFHKMNFLSTTNVVLLCSTSPSAPGGFPRNARCFARFLLDRDQPTQLLRGTSFAVLGLGHSITTSDNPNTFCRAAVRLDCRMEELGGHRLCAAGIVDLSHFIVTPVEAWRSVLFTALELHASEVGVSNSVLSARAHPDVGRDIETPLSISGRGASGSNDFMEGKVRAGCPIATTTGLDISSRRSPRSILVTYSCPPFSASKEMVETLAQLLGDRAASVPTVCTMNELVRRNWRGEFDLIIFVLAEGDDAGFPPNGSAFARVIRQHSAPRDMFASISYTVLAISEGSSPHFYSARKLDRRIETLGGTRVYARGELFDSPGAQRDMEKWSTRFLSLLFHSTEHAPSRRHLLPPHRAVSPRNRGVSGGLLGIGAATNSDFVPVEPLRHQRDALGSLEASHQQPNSPVVYGVHSGGIDFSVYPEEHESHHGNEAEGGEDAQSSISAEGGSHSVDASTMYECGTESSMVDRMAYSTENAGDRVDGVVQSWKQLTSGNVRDAVIQLDFLVTSGVRWSPGQTIAVLPSNDATEVEALLRLFRVKYCDAFPPLTVVGTTCSSFPMAALYDAVEFPASCGAILLHYVDLRVSANHKILFEVLDGHCGSAAAKKAVQELYASLRASLTPRSLLEILKEFVALAGNAAPPFRHVVEHLSLLRPRPYSICSSHLADPSTLSICFKVEESGLCTRWMREQCCLAAGFPHVSFATGGTRAANERQTPPLTAARQLVSPNTQIFAKRRIVIPFVIRRASLLRMPLDPLVPMIFIGPGTGIAPFRAFLQEREAWLSQRQRLSGSTRPKGGLCGCPYEEVHHHSHAACGSIDVFFGCRRRSEDFLFCDELTKWEESGVMHSLTVAFSRDANDGGFWYGGCYVQDKIEECGAALTDLILQRNAHLFVCGDADNMAKEVHAGLCEILQQERSITNVEAAALLEQMHKDGRYLRDVWSSAFRS